MSESDRPDRGLDDDSEGERPEDRHFERTEEFSAAAPTPEQPSRPTSRRERRRLEREEKHRRQEEARRRRRAIHEQARRRRSGEEPGQEPEEQGPGGWQTGERVVEIEMDGEQAIGQFETGTGPFDAAVEQPAPGLGADPDAAASGEPSGEDELSWWERRELKRLEREHAREDAKLHRSGSPAAAGERAPDHEEELEMTADHDPEAPATDPDQEAFGFDHDPDSDHHAEELGGPVAPLGDHGELGPPEGEGSGDESDFEDGAARGADGATAGQRADQEEAAIEEARAAADRIREAELREEDALVSATDHAATADANRRVREVQQIPAGRGGERRRG